MSNGRGVPHTKPQIQRGNYHHLYETPQELEEVLDEYIDFYNGYRPHRKLNMKTPIQYETEFFSAACS